MLFVDDDRRFFKMKSTRFLIASQRLLLAILAEAGDLAFVMTSS